MSKETGGSAFPNKASGCGGSSLDSNGMTLRDYFAAKAMQGIASNPDFTDWSWEISAEQAYKYADEMIVARGQ